MATKFKRISKEDIATILSDLDRWALGQLGSKLTWKVLEDRFGFSRQSLQAKTEIKAAYHNAKQALSGGLIKSGEETSKENEYLICQIGRLRKELEEYQRKELLWTRRWQQIAFSIRQKGMQVHAIDKDAPMGTTLPTQAETDNILRPFDKEIPPSGRV